MISRYWVPSSSALPPRPAITPETTKLKRIYFFTAKPLNSAAVIFRPTARSWKPLEVWKRK